MLAVKSLLKITQTKWDAWAQSESLEVNTSFYISLLSKNKKKQFLDIYVQYVKITIFYWKISF